MRKNSDLCIKVFFDKIDALNAKHLQIDQVSSERYIIKLLQNRR